MSNDTQSTNRPVENFRDGAIQVAVWPRQGQNGTFYEIERTRSYKDKNDEWQKTTLISERDMLKARRLEDQAYDAIQRLKEQDRALKDFQRTNDPAEHANASQETARDDEANLAQLRDDAREAAPEPQAEPAREPALER